MMNLGNRKTNRRKILILLIFSLHLIILSNLNTEKLNQEDFIDEDFDSKEPNQKQKRGGGINSNNELTGVGAPWNVTHYANHTEMDTLRFSNNTSDTSNVQLGLGWTGYKLNSTINNLVDERQWINGTMHFGDSDGYTVTDDDSDQTGDWDFIEVEDGGNNAMCGNYLDGSDPDTGGEDCLELRMNGRSSGVRYVYHNDDECYWNYSTVIPRGNLIDSTFSFDMKPIQFCKSNYWGIRVDLNEVTIFSWGTLEIYNIGFGKWSTISLPMSIWQETPALFDNPLYSDKVEIKIVLECTAGGDYSYGPEDGPGVDYQRVLIDNVKLDVKAEALPSQLNLKLNDTNSIIDRGYGSGTVEINGDWEENKIKNFQTVYTSPGGGVYGNYSLSFGVKENIFAYKTNQPTLSRKNTNSPGTSYIARNGSIVEWNSYSFVAEPTGYKETLMKIRYPTDVNITWLSTAQQPSINRLESMCDNTTKGLLIINVSWIIGSEIGDGFWNLKARSPNYIEGINIYNNRTANWVASREFYTNEYINVTFVIKDSSIISEYLEDTTARLILRFPNGTLCQFSERYGSPDENGFLKFGLIQVPDIGSDYEVGIYDLIVMWNNSHSNSGMNETGLFLKTINVYHYSKFDPDQTYYDDVAENSIINIKISYLDVNDDAILDADLYCYNFSGTGEKEFFSEIGPGYYFLAFNVSGAQAGENNLTIYANSTFYKNIKINLTIKVIYDTVLKAKEFPKITVGWKQNFTVHVNYTEKTSEIGIATNPGSNWNGENHTLMESLGRYTIEFNSSEYEANKLHSLVLYFNADGYERKSLIIKVQILDRETYLDDIYINNVNVTEDKSFSITTGKLMSIRVKYKDLKLSGKFIENASVNLIGPNLNKEFTEREAEQDYNVIINSADLGIGVTFLTISAEKENYTISSEVIVITVNKLEAYYNIFVNNLNITSEKIYSTELNTNLDILVYFRDDITRADITGASVSLIDFDDLDEDLSDHHYEISINSNSLNLGVNTLTLSMERSDYQSEYVNFVIDVEKMSTSLLLYLNDQEKTSEPSINIPYSSNLTISASYIYTKGGSSIGGASLTLKGADISSVMSEDATTGNYSSSFINSEFDIGTKFLTLTATKDDYQDQTILIKLNVTRIRGKMDPVDNKTVMNAIPGEDVSIKISLTNLDFDEDISNATIMYYSDELGSGELTKTEDGTYEITINNVPAGEYVFTISAYAGDDYTIKNLDISLNVKTPPEIFWPGLLLLIIASCIAGALGFYFILYYTVLKYPKPVRKVRKYRRKLRRNKTVENVVITDRDDSILKEHEHLLKDITKSTKKAKIIKPGEKLKKATEQN